MTRRPPEVGSAAGSAAVVVGLARGQVPACGLSAALVTVVALPPGRVCTPSLQAVALRLSAHPSFVPRPSLTVQVDEVVAVRSVPFSATVGKAIAGEEADRAPPLPAQSALKVTM